MLPSCTAIGKLADPLIEGLAPRVRQLKIGPGRSPAAAAPGAIRRRTRAFLVGVID